MRIQSFIRIFSAHIIELSPSGHVVRFKRCECCEIVVGVHLERHIATAIHIANSPDRLPFPPVLICACQCKKLNLVSVGLVGHPIRCLAVAKDFVFCGERGGIVSAWRRGKRVREYGSPDDAAVHALLVLGPLLLTLDEAGVVRVHTIDTGDLFVELADLDPAYFAATCMAHPATYLNKVCACPVCSVLSLSLSLRTLALD